MVIRGPWGHDAQELERIRQFREYVRHVWRQDVPLQDAEIAAGLTQADLDSARGLHDD